MERVILIKVNDRENEDCDTKDVTKWGQRFTLLINKLSSTVGEVIRIGQIPKNSKFKTRETVLRGMSRNCPRRIGKVFQNNPHSSKRSMCTVCGQKGNVKTKNNEL